MLGGGAEPAGASGAGGEPAGAGGDDVALVSAVFGLGLPLPLPGAADFEAAFARGLDAAALVADLVAAAFGFAAVVLGVADAFGFAAFGFAVPDFGPPASPGLGAPEVADRPAPAAAAGFVFEVSFARAVFVAPAAVRPVLVPPARGLAAPPLGTVPAAGVAGVVGAAVTAASSSSRRKRRARPATSDTALRPALATVSRMSFGLGAMRTKVPARPPDYTASA